MDTFRFWLALLTLMFMPGAVLFWFLIHPFVRFWRRLGLRRSVAIYYTLLAPFTAGVFLLRKTTGHGGSLALIANNLATYVNWIVAIPSVLLIVLIEERELHDRFGAEYEAYRARVPRFVPRWRGSASC